MITNIKIKSKDDLDGTDVILQDYELGQGKIIISGSDNRNTFSYYWGSMSSNLKDFLLQINSNYFVNKLSPYTRGQIDMKKTMTNVRKHIVKECNFRWYMDLEFQKELRDRLNYIQNYCDSDEYFVTLMQSIDVYLNYKNCDRKWQYEAEDAIGSISTEPWHFIINKEPIENIWLRKFLIKLQKELKKL